ncbi:MAG TPA: ABC transporter permease subunit, partial [Candidatus Acetothermia bacterium]|nr:ABC transporter permease subunit [Candidatus Acetothermia bacterium]
RPALVPLLTACGLTLGRLVAGAIVIEHLFGLPGLGQLALDAVRARDLPLLSGTALTVAGLIATVSLAVDLLYGALDPRVRYR